MERAAGERRRDRRGDLGDVAFIGRLEERRELVRFAEQQMATVLRGLAGVGKTRLAAEVGAQLAHRAGWRVLRRHSHRVPFQIF